MSNENKFFSHGTLEKNVGWLIIATIIVVSIAGLVQIVPLFFQHTTTEPSPGVAPYTALRLAGRDIYQREGCVGCHSQQIRTLRSEVERYGPYSLAGESVFDHPFLWGSKRTGPDLWREGKKYPDSWHFNHMIEPTSMSPGSIMPAYAFLYEQTLNTSQTADKLAAMKALGVPYEDIQIQHAVEDLEAQAKAIQAQLATEKIKIGADKEIIALIAYLQRLGTDISKK